MVDHVITSNLEECWVMVAWLQTILYADMKESWWESWVTWLINLFVGWYVLVLQMLMKPICFLNILQFWAHNVSYIIRRYFVLEFFWPRLRRFINDRIVPMQLEWLAGFETMPNGIVELFLSTNTTFVFQTEYSQPDVCPFTYRIDRSPMCEYLVNFIHKLKHLPKKFMMNSVLENFTILQVRII